MNVADVIKVVEEAGSRFESKIQADYVQWFFFWGGVVGYCFALCRMSRFNYYALQ